MKSPLRNSNICLRRLAQLHLLLRTLGVVWLIRIGLWILPFRWLRKILARIKLNPIQSTSHLEPAQIAWAVVVSSRFVPVATCLTQALVTDILLKHAGYQGTLHIGVAKQDNGRLQAHAWIEYEGVILIGGRGHQSFSTLPPIRMS